MKLTIRVPECLTCSGAGYLMREGTDGYNWRWCPKCLGYGVNVAVPLEALGFSKKSKPTNGVEYIDCEKKEG